MLLTLRVPYRVHAGNPVRGVVCARRAGMRRSMPGSIGNEGGLTSFDGDATKAGRAMI